MQDRNPGPLLCRDMLMGGKEVLRYPAPMFWASPLYLAQRMLVFASASHAKNFSQMWRLLGK
jgi:hypothetical protein